ncbi:hypothetical protein TraAM80_04031 [Trypanosoma rangeli]|uniref:PIN domain-containing protein n=1 Tax=Trypanosoma rangeli TaxID=5698 RepID=A0A3R7KEG3_TRYRA|nr:uncharacterized protein TraAM80_04031 [Trypanosoma rangeli]RNF06334.1 hypothetical protein TraAM80_04031 [Trypanosoma rangeli]|eukprot:RNF06334.1 hypothetical protein TraAM80_04031 [Trypanosoma rangeli]
MSLYSGSDSEYFAVSDSDAEAGPAPPRSVCHDSGMQPQSGSPATLVGTQEQKNASGSNGGSFFQQPTCFVVDTNAFLETDLVSQLAEMALQHLFIVPTKVLLELKRLSEEEGQKRATEVLRMIKSMEQLWNAENEQEGDVNAGIATGLRLQRAKERDSYVLRAARNYDDHILSCACHFTRYQRDMPVILLTGDEVLSLKAYAEGVLTLKTLGDSQYPVRR